MIHSFNHTNVNELHEEMCTRLMYGNQRGVDYDWVHGTEVGLHNVMLGATSFAWSFDLKRLWLPASRWTMMVRQYIDPTLLDQWLNKIEERLKGRGRGIAVLRTRMVEGKGSGRNVRRRWGSCMLDVSFRSNPVPTISLHSRTTYFGYLAAMDITVAHVLAREAGRIVGITPEEMNFVWTLDLAQFHGFRSLAWPLGDPEHKAEMDADVDDRLSVKLNEEPGYRKALDGYDRLLRSDRVGKLYGDEAFSSFCRVRRRFHTEVMGLEYANQFAGGNVREGGTKPFPPLPSVPIETLDLSCLDKVMMTDLDEDDDDD
jgi:hypothetical protein